MLRKATSAEMQLVNLAENDGSFKTTKIAAAPTLATVKALGTALDGI
jgi:hypothetical protein